MSGVTVDLSRIRHEVVEWANNATDYKQRACVVDEVVFDDSSISLNALFSIPFVLFSRSSLLYNIPRTVSGAENKSSLFSLQLELYHVWYSRPPLGRRGSACKL